MTFNSANHTVGGNRAVRLNNSFRAGPGLMLRVFPGDKIDAEVYAYHENNSGYSSSTTLANMVTAIAGAFGGVSGGAGESGTIYNTFNDALGVIGLGGNQGSTRPAAYLNYIFVDDQAGFNVTTQADNAGWVVVPVGAYMNKALMQLNIPVIKTTGYLYIYLSYENESSNYVYFDDLKITYQKSPVIQTNSYYAFGMSARSWTRFDTQPNKYLYNAGSELNDKTGSYEMFFRSYDPTIARMNGVDVMAEVLSTLTPYQYSNNNPVLLNDPTGAYPGGDEWWNAPRNMWKDGLDPQQRREQERYYAMSYTGTQIDPWGWTGIDPTAMDQWIGSEKVICQEVIPVPESTRRKFGWTGIL